MIVLISVLMMSTANLKVQAQAPTPSIVFSWSEETFRFSVDQMWDGTPEVLNFTGEYVDDYIHRNHYFNESGETWIREDVVTTHFANFSYFYNGSKTGYIKLDFILDVYQVDISIGTSGRVIWMAVKSGIMEQERHVGNETTYIDNHEEYHQQINTTYNVYNTTTWEVIKVWSEIEDVYGQENHTYNPGVIEWDETMWRTVEFSTPIFLTMQMYTTEKKDKIAWANVYHDFIFYKDIDNDGIYSIGDTSSSMNTMNMYVSDELTGVMKPIAEKVDYRCEKPTYNSSYTYQTPNDREIKEFASSIKFTAPSMIDNKISWDIVYPDFPIDAFTRDYDIPFEDWFNMPPNAPYAHTSPGTFSYLFDYIIDDTQADLDITLDLPKITNETFYKAVQGYGLSLPQYNYFLSTFDIKEETPIDLTFPADTFDFVSNDSIVATFDMMKKDNYTVYDYPKLSENTISAAEGASVNKLVAGLAETSLNPGNIFSSLVYGIKSVVNSDKLFAVQGDLLRIQTQNYPLWGGERFVHDPTLSIYYENYTTGVGDIAHTVIWGYPTALVVGTVIAVATIKIERKKKKFNL